MQDVHWMTVCACENTVLIEVHPGHLTSMKYEVGLCTRRLSLCVLASASEVGFKRSTMGLYMVPGGGARERESEKSTSTGKSKITVGDQGERTPSPRARRAASRHCAGSGGRSRAGVSAPPLNPASAACAALRRAAPRKPHKPRRADRDRHSHCNEGDNLNLMDGGQWLDGLSWP